MQAELKVFLDDSLLRWGFSHYGLAPLTRPLSFDFYAQWLQDNKHGDMSYLAEHASTKENPQLKWKQAKTALTFAMPYFPHPRPLESFPLRKARLSLYAQGEDYHLWFRQKLENLAGDLRARYPEHEFLCFTDSSPILERDLSYRAGLGWVGKNTCLIHPRHGSLFFLGEILTSLEEKTELEPLPDFCGTCQRCMQICPTQALTAPREMDARKCISYLTIESRQVPPLELRAKIGDWLFGCDLCQTVCPWNQKIFKAQLKTETMLSLDENEVEILIADLRYLLASSGKKLTKDFQGTALARAGSFGLKKNALVVAGNRHLSQLKPEVEALLEHPKLGELAQWTLHQFEFQSLNT